MEMNKVILLFQLSTLLVAQVETSGESPVINDTTVVEETIDILATIPQELQFGYKGYAWGNPQETASGIFMTQVGEDSNSVSFSGVLGTDSVLVSYFFADSGFWKVEINFILDPYSIDKEIQFFTRLEKNISEVYGPTLKTTQIQGGPGPAYANSIYPKFSRAYYRSTWVSTPVMIELLLNALVLLPATDLPIFSGDFSILKLVYYNPDYMIASFPLSEPKPLPSIFEIY